MDSIRSKRRSLACAIDMRLTAYKAAKFGRAPVWGQRYSVYGHEVGLAYDGTSLRSPGLPVRYFCRVYTESVINEQSY